MDIKDCAFDKDRICDETCCAYILTKHYGTLLKSHCKRKDFIIHDYENEN